MAHLFCKGSLALIVVYLIDIDPINSLVWPIAILIGVHCKKRYINLYTGVDLSTILGANQNIGGQKVVKSDKCMGISQLLGDTCPGCPLNLHLWMYRYNKILCNSSVVKLKLIGVIGWLFDRKFTEDTPRWRCNVCLTNFHMAPILILRCVSSWFPRS